MVRQLWLVLDQSGTDLKYDTYCEKIEKWVNQDENGMKRFVFVCYDTMDTERITDKGLFKFMNTVSRKVPGINHTPTELLSLHEHDSDMFLDLFAADFVKITDALHEKAKLIKSGKIVKPKPSKM